MADKNKEKTKPLFNDMNFVVRSFLDETRNLAEKLKTETKDVGKIAQLLISVQDNPKLLQDLNEGFIAIYKLQLSLIGLYNSIQDKKILLNENIEILIQLVADKITEICEIIEDDIFNSKKITDFEEINIASYLLYLDKAIAGEIFDSKILVEQKSGKKNRKKRSKEKDERALKVALATSLNDEIISIKSSELSQMVTMHEEMIARTYIINNQIELFKDYVATMPRELKESYKLLSSDCQNIQNSLLISHDKIISLIHDDAFLQSHQDFQGFFVMANGSKYLIPAFYVDDVVSENPLNYEIRQNQKFFVYVHENESGSNEEREEIPVYSLSSLFPGQMQNSNTILDTILLVSYQQQKIGIIVEEMLKFVSLIKKPMPGSFENFSILQGFAFDEKYDLIPILHIPDIMKKFRAMRSYDVKKFDVKTRKRPAKILIVEDSETTREIEYSILSSNGFVVDCACDGIEGMEKLHEKQFDIVITDDAMPRMNGEIFLDNLRRMENYAKIPVIALSENILEKANCFICKSDFKRDDFIQTIKETLKGA